MPTAEILSQGDEVVTGQTVDTNAAWLAERLTEHGFTVLRHTAVSDVLSDIRDLVQQAAQRADFVICTGGLGPTSDDLTAQAVAEAFGTPLEFDEQAFEHIKALYARYARSMPEVNRKQAWLPQGATRLDNHWGTAPGFAVRAPDGALLAFLPGVPREMRKLWEHAVAPLLREQFELPSPRLVTLRTTGVGESNLQERLDGVALPEGVALGYRTMLPENHVKLRIQPGVPEAVVADLVEQLSERIGKPLFTVEGMGGPRGGLAAVLGRLLVERGETLAVAESCTGGRVASLCTAIPGSSDWFLEGAVTYSNAAKVRQLGVQQPTLDAHGAVSTEVSHQMARGIREAAGATYGLSTTGIAGPTGGSEDKPVGTVHVALATPTTVVHRKLQLGGNRERIQDLSAAAALDLLRRHLQFPS